MVAAGILGVVVSCTNRNGHIPFHSGVPYQSRQEECLLWRSDH